MGGRRNGAIKVGKDSNPNIRVPRLIMFGKIILYRKKFLLFFNI